MSKDDVTWTQVNRWWPIGISLLAVALTYGSLLARLSIVETKLDNVLTLLEAQQRSQSNIISNLNDLNQRLAVVETLYAVRK